MPKQNKRQTGSLYEEAAAAYLTAEGVSIIKKNFRCRAGEIDLIGTENGYLVFFEVKYRRDSRMGCSLTAIGPLKQQRILTAAKWYMMEQHLPGNTPVRFDAVGIDGDRITWVRNAFGA